jgi:hypothetical protein
MTLLQDVGLAPLLDPSRQERRRLRRIDRETAARATLVRVREVLEDAAGIVDAGWLQEAWFGVRDATGREWAIGSAAAATVDAATVTRACLVGAIVLAAGGPATAQPARARRGIEAVWHALQDDPGPVRWCPGPVVGGAHVRDLTLWNDRPGRTPDEVRALLARGSAVAAAELVRLGS